jgi:hypothetical protein
VRALTYPPPLIVLAVLLSPLRNFSFISLPTPSLSTFLFAGGVHSDRREQGKPGGRVTEDYRKPRAAAGRTCLPGKVIHTFLSELHVHNVIDKCLGSMVS